MSQESEEKGAETLQIILAPDLKTNRLSSLQARNSENTSPQTDSIDPSVSLTGTITGPEQTHSAARLPCLPLTQKAGLGTCRNSKVRD